jgi:carbonic anhydrase
MTDQRCRACLLYCIDFRLHDHLERFLIDRGLRESGSDVVRVAGSALQLAHPESDHEREFVLGQLEASRRLHDVEEIYLVNHENCGAYGMRSSPESASELDTHREDLRRARAVLRERLPDVAVSTFFQWLDGSLTVID